MEVSQAALFFDRRLDRRTHACQDLIAGEGAREIVIRAQSERFDLFALLAAGQERDQGQVGASLPDPPDDVTSIHAGEVELKKRETERLAFYACYSL
jgi:hypothetical protein